MQSLIFLLPLAAFAARLLVLDGFFEEDDVDDDDEVELPEWFFSVLIEAVVV